MFDFIIGVEPGKLHIYDTMKGRIVQSGKIGTYRAFIKIVDMYSEGYNVMLVVDKRSPAIWKEFVKYWRLHYVPVASGKVLTSLPAVVDRAVFN
jgi:hypothetical protein